MEDSGGVWTENSPHLEMIKGELAGLECEQVRSVSPAGFASRSSSRLLCSSSVRQNLGEENEKITQPDFCLPGALLVKIEGGRRGVGGGGTKE